jgi:uncharacterized YccA/Bax inhibitor family protein
MATANPAANVNVYDRTGFAASAANVMTLQGAIFKTSVLLAILVAAASVTWSRMEGGTPATAYPLMLLGAIGGLIIAMVTIFKPTVSPITAPLYAACQGLLVGAISAAYNALYNGLVVQAIGLTLGVLAALLIIYASRIIRATENFKIGVVAATGGIFLLYLVNIILSFFGIHIPFIHQSGMLGIGFSIAVVVIAALNLILDFDFIETGVQRGAPKYMEWYGGFSLLVTLVWMYLEILRLLAKLQSNRN